MTDPYQRAAETSPKCETGARRISGCSSARSIPRPKRRAYFASRKARCTTGSKAAFGGKRYKPIIREEARGSRAVTWAEFVEAGLLRQYRREHQVPMTELRHFIAVLREKLGVPYPLAHRQPFIGVGRQLVVEAQDEADLAPDFFLVAVAREQLVLTAPSQSFVDRVTWENDGVAAWRPHDDLKSPVRVNPVQRFGRPAVGGISTEVI